MTKSYIIILIFTRLYLMTLRLSLKLLFPVFIFFIFSCKKDHKVLGVNEQPAGDQINAQYISGMVVTGHSLPYDSIACFNDGYKFLGSNNDPSFGRVDIGLYFNTSIDGALNFVDSRVASAEIVLALVNSNYAGDANAVLNYSIFPITAPLDPTQVYYTNNANRHGSTPIITGVVATSTDAVTGQPVLRLKMDSTYAEKLMHDTANLASNDRYQVAYPGYYIATSLQSGDGVLFEANLDDALSGFFLHYKTNPSDTITNYKFSLTTSTTRYNTVKFTPKQALKNQFADSTLGSSDLYVKGMGLSRVKLQIPFLQNYSDTFKIAVNRAEIILNVDPSFANSSYYYPPPPQLTILSMDSLSRETYIKDLLNSVDYTRFDGTYDATNNRYVFNIAREAQQILDGKKLNRGFYLIEGTPDITLIPTYSGLSKQLVLLRRDSYFQGVVFAGSGSQLKPTFNLSYVRFKKE